MPDLSPELISFQMTLEERARQAAELFQNGYRLQSMGLAPEAVTMYRRSIELKPTAEAHTCLARAYRLGGQIPEAIEECRQAILIDPGFGGAHNDLGAYLVDREQYAEAIPSLERALECSTYPTPHYAWYNLARAHRALGNLSLARACLRQAVKVKPDYTLALEAIRQVQALIQARNRAVLG